MTCAVATRRQVSNGQLKTMGIRPTSSYHWQVMPGDVVRVQVVIEDPFGAETFDAVVESAEHHGHYKLVGYRRLDNNDRCTGWLFAERPPDWGIVEFRVIKAASRPRPKHDDPLRRDRGDALCRLDESTRCPACGAVYNWIPKLGWPCIECRVETAKRA